MAQTWREGRYAALDFESTGMNPARDEVVQAGLVALDGDRLRLGSAWASWVRPTRPFAPASVAVHGLSYESLQDAPPVAAVRLALAAQLRDRVLVAHYATLELGFLRRWQLRPQMAIDTLFLALALDGVHVDRARRDAYTLSALARRCGVTVYGEHDALADALITAQVFLALASELEARGRVRTVRDLAGLSGRWGRGLFGR
ncbi:MAG: 3'-5' exonuclease [Deinococcota bacterium]